MSNIIDFNKRRRERMQQQPMNEVSMEALLQGLTSAPKNDLMADVANSVREKITRLLIMTDIASKASEMLLQNRYGGYWRYPKMLDFCYLVNPFFPPKQMLEEMKSNFYLMMMQHPSGMAVNSMLAGKMFGVRSENIVVGNGAAELIKALLEHMSGGLGIIRPTFEEYPNRYPKEKLYLLFSDSDDFSIMAEDIMGFLQAKIFLGLCLSIRIILVGNYIKKSGLNDIDPVGGETEDYLDH